MPVHQQVIVRLVNALGVARDFNGPVECSLEGSHDMIQCFLFFGCDGGTVEFKRDRGFGKDLQRAAKHHTALFEAGVKGGGSHGARPQRRREMSRDAHYGEEYQRRRTSAENPPTPHGINLVCMT